MAKSKRKLMDLTGQLFGRLTVLREVESKWYSFYRKGRTRPTRQRRRFWECLCDCGNITVVTHGALKQNTISCGCWKKESVKTQSITHGCSSTPEYTTWSAMRGRCNNPNSPNAPDYRERGITICERWDDFSNFLEDMGKRPSPQHSVERRDNDGNYCPENCYWGTPIQQGNNKRNNILLTFQNQTYTLAEWSRIRHINYPTLRARIKAYHWSTERALTEPVQSVS